MSIIIPHAYILNPDKSFTADIRLENGKIKALEKPGTLAPAPDDELIDASGLWVMPGGIDPHVHLSLPTPAGFSADDFITGGRAALAGGNTHIIDFVTPQRGQDLSEALEQRWEEAKDCPIGLKFHMGISGWLPDMEQQMERCVKEKGIQSFKTYLAYRKNIGIGYEELEQIMRIAAKLDAIVLVHAEEDDTIEALRAQFIREGSTHPRFHPLSRPPQTESNAVSRVIELIQKTGCKTYFVHISTAQSADYIARAKKQGLPVYAETCPQYLLLDDRVYEGSFESTAPYVFSPPAREEFHREMLWEHLQLGTFDTIGTDHCPFNMAQKSAGRDNFTLIPNGAGGLEFRIPLMHHFGLKKEKINQQQFIQLSSGNAATIFGLQNKGMIAKGYDADLLLFNPSTEVELSAATQHQHCDINIYEGMRIKGQTQQLIRQGMQVFNASQNLHH